MGYFFVACWQILLQTFGLSGYKILPVSPLANIYQNNFAAIKSSGNDNHYLLKNIFNGNYTLHVSSSYAVVFKGHRFMPIFHF